MNLDLLLDSAETAKLLDRLADAVAGGSLKMADGPNAQTVEFADTLAMTVKAHRRRTREQISLTIQWKRGSQGPSDLTISG